MAKLNTAIRGAQIADAVAGDGLKWTTDDIMGLDLKASGGLKIDTGELTIEPADFAGDGLKDDGSDNLALDLNELTAIVVDVAADELAIVDATDGSTKKESIVDIVSAMAGVGLAASNGVLSVADNIVESDIKVQNESANCNDVTTDFILDDTPVVNSVQVFLRGLLQEEGSGKDYTLSGTTVAFTTAPSTGDMLIIHYVINNA